MPDKPSISIIIPTKNRPEFLKEAVDSVLNQTYQASEIIIVDDNSEEKYQEEINSIAETNKRIQLHRFEEQRGVSCCRNFGIEKSTGMYLLFLDDDDTLEANMLENSLDSIEDVDVTSCRTSTFFDSELDKKKDKVYNWQKYAELDIYKMEEHPAEHIFLYHPMIHSFLFRKSVFDEVRFPEHLSYGEDCYVWLKLASRNFKFRKLNFAGGNCRIHEGNQSDKSTILDKLKFYNEMQEGLVLSKKVKNLVYIKVSAILLKSHRISFMLYLGKAISHPLFFIRHMSHFLKIYY